MLMRERFDSFSRIFSESIWQMSFNPTTDDEFKLVCVLVCPTFSCGW